MPTRPEIQRQARQQAADVARIYNRGIVPAARLGALARRAALRSYARGGDPAATFLRVFDPFQRILNRGMAVSQMTGIWRARTPARRAPLALAISTPYDSAVVASAKLLKFNTAEAKALEAQYGVATSRAYAKLGDYVGEKVTAALEEITAKNMHVVDAQKRLSQAFALAGVVPENSYTVENFIRTHTQLAYAAGKAQEERSEPLSEILWGYEYATVGDDRVRDEHALMEGVRLPVDDPFWQANYPPNGWSCRCAAIAIFDEEEPVYPPPGTKPLADPGFRFNPADLFDEINLKPSWATAAKVAKPAAAAPKPPKIAPAATLPLEIPAAVAEPPAAVTLPAPVVPAAGKKPAKYEPPTAQKPAPLPTLEPPKPVPQAQAINLGKLANVPPGPSPAPVSAPAKPAAAVAPNPVPSATPIADAAAPLNRIPVKPGDVGRIATPTPEKVDFDSSGIPIVKAKDLPGYKGATETVTARAKREAAAYWKTVVGNKKSSEVSEADALKNRAAMKDWVGGGYSDIRQYQAGKLYNGSAISPEWLRRNEDVPRNVARMQSLFDKAPKVDGTYHRGFGSAPDELVAAHLVPGAVIETEAFTSFTAQGGFAHGWGGKMIVEVRGAKNGSYIDSIGIGGEHEILVSKGFRYRVVGIYDAKTGAPLTDSDQTRAAKKIRVVAEYVAPGADLAPDFKFSSGRGGVSRSKVYPGAPGGIRRITRRPSNGRHTTPFGFRVIFTPPVA